MAYDHEERVTDALQKLQQVNRRDVRATKKNRERFERVKRNEKILNECQ